MKEKKGGRCSFHECQVGRLFGRGDPIKVRYIRFEVAGEWHLVRHKEAGWGHKTKKPSFRGSVLVS